MKESSNFLTFYIPALFMALLGIGVGAAQSPQYVQGPRGGCYEVTKAGGKKPVKRSLCGTDAAGPSQANGAASQEKAQPKPAPAAAATAAQASGNRIVKGNRTYVKGPKGGCYYVTGSGRKEYVDRSMCQ